MNKKEILKKIESGKIRMKPKWQFVIQNWAEWGVWVVTILMMVMAGGTIGYFMTVYNPAKWIEFGELGWQVFYEDFPYFWMIVWILFSIGGGTLLLNIGKNYKRSWKKNLIITIGVAMLVSMIVFVVRLLA